MTVYNRTDRWLGDYVGAGVTRIEMDLRNFTTQPLTIRIGLKQFTGQGVPGYATSNAKAFILPADGRWHRAGFDLTDSDMVPINGPFVSLTEVLSGGVNGFQELRIVHSLSPSLQGDNISGTMGIDNITAIPAPGAVAVLTLAGGPSLRRVRRRPSSES
ncbi:MAG: hypothetical protein ACK4WH_04635 [Phycisphaerales bacterium]